MFFELVQFLENNPSWKAFYSNEKYSKLRKWINDSIPILNNKQYTFQTKIYWILNNYTDFPKCKQCGKIFNYNNVISISKGYIKFCSYHCAVNSSKTKEKTKQTCLKKYGTISPGQNEEIKQKSKQTCLKKYGTEYSFQSSVVREKTKNTCLKKYGVDSASKSSIIQDKIQATKTTRYGDNQPWHSQQAYTMRKSNWFEKYGVDHPMKNEEIKKKWKTTNKERYGANSIFELSNWQYDLKHKIFNRIFLDNIFDVPLFTFDEFFNRVDTNVELYFKCKKCGNVFKSKHTNGQHKHCEKCFPKLPKTKSDQELEVVDFLKSLNLNIVQADRNILKPLELDVYIPEKNFAIEYDGLYWHNDNYKPKNYHLNKTIACEENKIKLVHIFENEWILKKDIVCDRLKNILGIYDKVIFARKCIIKEVSSNESREFQETNHLQGAVNSKISLGLYFENQLVSLMTFSKCRFDKKHEWEMLRFCSKLGYHIPGAAGKLLKYFERNYKPKSLVTYADRRWSQGKLYNTLGFNLLHKSPPNYFYFSTKQNKYQLYSRVKFQKHKLKNILLNFDSSKSEVQNMKDNGYLRIFDCGNLVFEKTY